MTDVPRITIVNIIGNLGNQMFQYACAYALGKNFGLTIKVATGMFDEYTIHNRLELSRVFLTSASVAEPRDMRNLLGEAGARNQRPANGWGLAH